MNVNLDGEMFSKNVLEAAQRLAAQIRCEQERHAEVRSRQRYLLKRRMRELRSALRRSKPCPHCGRRVA